MDETLTTYDGCHARVAPAYGPRGAWTVAYVWSGEDPCSPCDRDVVRAYAPWIGEVYCLRTRERENGIPEGCRLVVPADCQSDPWGLEGRWVNAETGETVLPPDPEDGEPCPTHLLDGEPVQVVDEVIDGDENELLTGSRGVYALGDLASDDQWPNTRILADGRWVHWGGGDPVEIEPGEPLRETT